MRGISAFVLDVLLPGLFASLFAFSILISARKSWRKRHQVQPQGRKTGLGKARVASTAILIWITLMFGVSYVQLRIHYDLWALHRKM